MDVIVEEEFSCRKPLVLPEEVGRPLTDEEIDAWREAYNDNAQQE